MIGIALMVVESLIVLANLYRLKRQKITETPAELQNIHNDEAPMNNSMRRVLEGLTPNSTLTSAPETEALSLETEITAATTAPLPRTRDKFRFYPTHLFVPPYDTALNLEGRTI